MARVLVLEDDGSMRSIIRAALTAGGHEVFDAADGRAGLRVFGATKPELVITDLLMPVIDGIALLRSLRAYGSPVRIIAISGGSGTLDSEDLLTAAIRLGANAALRKPFRPSELLSLVSEVLAQQPHLAMNDARHDRRMVSRPNPRDQCSGSEWPLRRGEPEFLEGE